MNAQDISSVIAASLALAGALTAYLKAHTTNKTLLAHLNTAETVEKAVSNVVSTPDGTKVNVS